MALTGRRVCADEALVLGLVHRLSDDPLTDALSLASEFASKPPEGGALTKQLMRESASRDLPAGVSAEAQVQRDALHRPAFAELWSGWQATVTGT
jgi:enoyl-CoA hydratase/carnithine racemase